MSSPFSIFRKNQKMMLALLTILTMFGFVLLPTIIQLMGGGRMVSDPVVLKTKKFGNLRKSELIRLQNCHKSILAVLGQLRAMGRVASDIAEGKLSEEYGRALMDRYATLYRREFEQKQLLGPATQANVAETWLLTQQAKQSGMVIGEDAIKDLVKEITQDLVKPADVQAALAHVGLADQQFIDLMIDELLALNLRNEFQISVNLSATTPGQRWDYYNRVHRLATVEAVPVAVADYVKKISDPKEAVLKDFFEKNKQRDPNAESPEPGFHRPQMIALEYFRADYDKFASPQTVTDAEIRQEYEKHKDYYDRLNEKSTEKEPAEKAEKKEQKPVEKALPKPVDKKVDKKLEKKEPKPAEKPAKKTSSTIAGASPFVLTAFAQDKQTDDKASPSAKKAEPLKKPADAKAEKKPEKKTEAPNVGLPDLPQTSLPGLPNAGLPGLPSRPLSEDVKNSIRRAIARERIIKVFDVLRVKMDEYGQEWSKYDVERIMAQSSADGRRKPLGPEPPRPDLKSLAKQNKLTADETALMAEWELQRLPIGISQPVQVIEGELRAGGGAPVWDYAYKSLSSFRPAMATDGEGLYLFWKTQDEKEHVPKFDDVHDEVLHAWKMIEARKLALEAAKTLAAEAEKANKPLKQVFADRPELHVVLPSKFSWMTFGNVASLESVQRPHLCPVAGVGMAGDEFMRAVFGLDKPGQVAVAFNVPKTVAYVVQLTEFSPTYEARKVDFENEDFRKYAAIGREDQQRIEQAWLNGIEVAAGFEWTPGNRPEETANSSQPSGSRGPSESDQPWED